jgi:hypothetical protein
MYCTVDTNPKEPLVRLAHRLTRIIISHCISLARLKIMRVWQRAERADLTSLAHIYLSHYPLLTYLLHCAFNIVNV